jgi:hypothetical protein
MEQLCHQVSQKAIPIFESLHPDSQAVFVFDCSSAHGTFAKSALRVQNMNLKPGGKQSKLRDSFIPSDDPCIPPHLRGLPQSFCYPCDHPEPNLAGQPKGVCVILQERGIWQHYTSMLQNNGQPLLKFQCENCKTSNVRKDAEIRAVKLIRQAEESGYFVTQDQCVSELLAENSNSTANDNMKEDETNSSSSSTTYCWLMILSQQSDFLHKRPLLQAIIEDAGHICLFLPKFHCELNPIELFWSYIKDCK